MCYEYPFELTDQGNLAAILHLPPPSMRPCPLIIYCPGKNGERADVHRIAVKLSRELAQKGIGSLRFDYYGLGLSDGEFHEVTTATKVSNVIKALDYAICHREVRTDAISLLGFSDGARTSILAAVRAGVDRLVLWSPVFHEMAGNYPSQKRPRFVRNPLDPRTLALPWAGLWIGMPFYRELKETDVTTAIHQFKGRSLIVYGGDDPLVREGFDEMDYGLLPIFSGTGRHRVHKMEGAGHLFASELEMKTIIGETANWVWGNSGQLKGKG